MGKLNLVSGAEYWDFKENAVFTGIYKKEVFNDETGDLMGYVFTDASGEPHIIPATHAVDKALNTEIPGQDGFVRSMGYPITFEWMGKVEKKDGQTYNKFNIDVDIPDETEEIEG